MNTINKNEMRFKFGKNWKAYSNFINEDRLTEAKKSLCDCLEVDNLTEKRFIDVGSGSGLFSLAASRLGANVFSFDFDKDSVECTKQLKEKYATNSEWDVTEGSILDLNFVNNIDSFDIVYSWGVLHHTGDMWQALENVETLVKPGGKLYIAIYNDQGRQSLRWKKIKQIYVTSGRIARCLLITYSFFKMWTKTIIMDCLKLNPLYSWNEYKINRGMSAYYDLIDWVGGYPFEVAKPEEIFDYFHKKNYSLIKLKTCAGGIGCNEYVFLNRNI